jgi:hypothetical protein
MRRTRLLMTTQHWHRERVLNSPEFPQDSTFGLCSATVHAGRVPPATAPSAGVSTVSPPPCPGTDIKHALRRNECNGVPGSRFPS